MEGEELTNCTCKNNKYSHENPNLKGRMSKFISVKETPLERQEYRTQKTLFRDPVTRSRLLSLLPGEESLNLKTKYSFHDPYPLSEIRRVEREGTHVRDGSFTPLRSY